MNERGEHFVPQESGDSVEAEWLKSERDFSRVEQGFKSAMAAMREGSISRDATDVLGEAALSQEVDVLISRYEGLRKTFAGEAHLDRLRAETAAHKLEQLRHIKNTLQIGP